MELKSGGESTELFSFSFSKGKPDVSYTFDVADFGSSLTEIGPFISSKTLFRFVSRAPKLAFMRLVGEAVLLSLFGGPDHTLTLIISNHLVL